MLMLFAPLERLTGINNTLQAGLTATESVFEIIDQPQEKNTGVFRKTEVKGEIKVLLMCGFAIHKKRC